MNLCLNCTNALLGKKEKDCILESEVTTKHTRCYRCKKTCLCVKEFLPAAVKKIPEKEFCVLVKQAALEILDRWDDPDFQKEKAELRKSASCLPDKHL